MAQTITINGISYSDVPSIEVPLSSSGTASFYDVSDTTASASDVSSGKYFYTSSGVKSQGAAPTQAAQTIIPTTIDQTIASGTFLTGTQTIKGDANLIAANIAYGVTIFGITGTHKGGDTSLIFMDVSVPTSAWNTYTPTSNSEEEYIYDLGYQYRATITLTGVTADMYPLITWSLVTLDESGTDIIDQYQCISGGVYIYANVLPEAPLKALTIDCRKENS